MYQKYNILNNPNIYTASGDLSPSGSSFLNEYENKKDQKDIISKDMLERYISDRSLGNFYTTILHNNHGYEFFSRISLLRINFENQEEQKEIIKQNLKISEYENSNFSDFYVHKQNQTIFQNVSLYDNFYEDDLFKLVRELGPSQTQLLLNILEEKESENYELLSSFSSYWNTNYIYGIIILSNNNLDNLAKKLLTKNDLTYVKDLLKQRKIEIEEWKSKTEEEREIVEKDLAETIRAIYFVDDLIEQYDMTRETGYKFI